jgi:hypothetical protein
MTLKIGYGSYAQTRPGKIRQNFSEHKEPAARISYVFKNDLDKTWIQKVIDPTDSESDRIQIHKIASWQKRSRVNTGSYKISTYYQIKGPLE